VLRAVTEASFPIVSKPLMASATIRLPSEIELYAERKCYGYQEEEKEK